MKKLFSVMSIILCMAMLAMSVSAAGTVAGEDPYVIFKKAMDKASGLKYVEMKGFLREETINGDRTETRLDFLSARFTLSSDNKVNTEYISWDENSEMTSWVYFKDGYYYDSIKREKYTDEYYSTAGEMVRDIVGLESNFYRDGIKNLTAEQTPDGYELRYKVPWSGSYYSDSSYTVVLDRDYTIKSVREYYRSINREPGEEEERTTIKYEFVSVDKPFNIDFPYDLNSYTIAD